MTQLLGCTPRDGGYDNFWHFAKPDTQLSTQDFSLCFSSAIEAHRRRHGSPLGRLLTVLDMQTGKVGPPSERRGSGSR